VAIFYGDFFSWPPFDDMYYTAFDLLNVALIKSFIAFLFFFILPTPKPIVLVDVLLAFDFISLVDVCENSLFSVYIVLLVLSLLIEDFVVFGVSISLRLSFYFSLFNNYAGRLSF
jgi:hypothetical protein